MYILVLRERGRIGSIGSVVGPCVSFGPESEWCSFVSIEIDLLSVERGTYYLELSP